MDEISTGTEVILTERLTPAGPQTYLASYDSLHVVDISNETNFRTLGSVSLKDCYLRDKRSSNRVTIKA